MYRWILCLPNMLTCVLGDMLSLFTNTFCYISNSATDFDIFPLSTLVWVRLGWLAMLMDYRKEWSKMGKHKL